jgi:hypothetical protein
MVSVSFSDPDVHERWVRHKNSIVCDYDKAHVMDQVKRAVSQNSLTQTLRVLSKNKTFVHDHSRFDVMVRLKLIQCFVANKFTHIAVPFTEECYGVEPVHLLQWYLERCPDKQAGAGPALSSAAVERTLNNLRHTNTFT